MTTEVPLLVCPLGSKPSSSRTASSSDVPKRTVRTHGGVSEAKVPFILSRPLNDTYKLKAGASTLKSLQIFDFAINGTL